MKKIYLSLITAFFFVTGSFAQTVVVAGADAGTLAGNPYTTLKAAFDNINLASQAGNVIVITVTGVTTEATSASLNQSVGPWTSLTIIPVGASQITGNFNGHLVDLNGADNVTIDGLNAAGNSLAINNANGGSSSSTIRFIADATNNTLNKVNILGSAGNTLGTGFGVVFFSTGTATGNDNNTINQCIISASSGGTPLNAIYSLGTSAAIDNSNNTISVNNISDYFSAGTPSAGMNINSNNSGWTITNNALYQTATRIATTGGTHNGILITSGVGYTISNNVIGYAAPNATGTTNMIGYASGTFPGSGTFPTAYTPGGTANALRYNAINCAFTAGGGNSTIQNNTIGGFALYSSSGASTTFGVFCGIAVTSGNAGIGTVTGNTIGSASGTSSIYVASTTAGAVVSGIYCTTTNSISIQNNTIGGIDVSGTTAAQASGFKGIDAAGTGTYVISSNNVGNATANNIRTGYLLTGANLSNSATTPTTATGGSVVTGILTSAAGTTMFVTDNIIRGLQVSGSVTTFTGINCTGANTTLSQVNNNQLGTAATNLINYAVANSGTLTGISHTGLAAAAALSISSNSFRGINYTVASTNANIYISWSHASSVTDNINSNTFNNLNVNTTGSVTFMVRAGNLTATGIENVNSNSIVTGFNKGGAGGQVVFFNANASSVLGSVMNNTLNNFSNVTVSGATQLIGWSNTDGASTASGPNKNISNNTFSNIIGGTAAITIISSNFGNNGTTVSGNTISGIRISPIAAAITLTGISIGTSNAGALQTVSNNIVSGLTSNTTGGQAIGILGGSISITTFNITNNTISGITSTSTAGVVVGGIFNQNTGTTVNISKNKVYDINCLAVIGINSTATAAGNTINLSNNYVGRLYAPTSTFFQAARGINVQSTVAATFNLFYNTVYLDGTVPTQTYCVYIGGATVNVPNVNARNNIFVNNVSSSNGATLPQTVYFRLGVTNGTNLAATSNNNILYCGTPAVDHLIYVDGAVNALTNPQQTLAGYQALVSTRENLSITTLPPFINTTLPATNSYLHINPSIVTPAESGAVNIATYTDDYDADIRQGNPGYPGTSSGTAPDIGADEFDITVDHYGPEILYTALASSVCTSSKTFTATITDYSGVNVTAGTLPRVYYKKSTNANALGGTNTNATDGWKYAEGIFLGGSSFSFTIDYTLVFGGVAAGDNIQYFVTAQDMFSPVNVGINSGTFAASPASVALTGAAFPLTGTINNYNIVLPIPTLVTIGAAGTYPSLSGAGGLFADLNNKGLSGNTVVNIIDPVITETGANALNQMVYDCAGPFTLTIKPNAAGTVITGVLASNALLKIKSSNVIIDGSSNGSASRDLTITNTSVTAPTVVVIGSTGTLPVTNTTMKNCVIINGAITATAIVVSDGSSLGSAGYFNNISIQNNDIRKAYNGIYAIATVTAGNGSGLNIQSNIFNSVAANAIGHVGVYVQGVDGATVSGNDIGNFESATNEVDAGIWFATGTRNSVIEKNNIHDIQYTGTGGYGAKGVMISTGQAAANVSVQNNMISGMTGDGDSYTANGALFDPVGIYVFGTGQGGINIYYNSIYLTGSTLNFSANAYSIGIALDNNSSANIKDNIVKNELGLLGGIGVGAVGIAAQTSSAQFISLDYNDYYSLAVLGTNLIGKIGATDYATLAAWQTATGQEANSLNANPVFTSANDLHLVSALNCELDGYGTPIAGIITDFDNQTRDVAAPDMGADEFTAVYVAIPAGIVGSAVCANKTVSPLGTTYATSTCLIIANVLPSGGSAVSGKINACVTLDATPQFFNGEPYVQRHFDIEPAVNAATATATITLYYTDAEFTQYNTTNPVYPPMPTFAGGANGDPNRANVRITQFHGTPTGGLPTSTPGNYTGVRVLITPAVITDVFWTGSYWAVTIPVTGFSGFYAHTTLTNTPLPVSVNYLNGRKQGSDHLLDWRVTCVSTPKATMTLQRSSDARNYTGIYTITADAARCASPFDYTDASPLKGMNYYRLKIVDVDGNITYSTTVALLNAVKGFDIISIAPNPVVNDNFKLNVASAQAGKMEIVIVDMQGRLINRQSVTLIAGFNSLPVNVGNLAAGTYSMYGITGEDKSRTVRFVKQ